MGMLFLAFVTYVAGLYIGYRIKRISTKKYSQWCDCGFLLCDEEHYMKKTPRIVHSVDLCVPSLEMIWSPNDKS